MCFRTLADKLFEYPIIFDIEDQKSLANPQNCVTLSVLYLKKRDIIMMLFCHISELKKIDYNGTFGLWQYSWNGRIDGISGDVDLDYAYKDYPTIIKSARSNGFIVNTHDESNTLEKILQHVVSIDNKLK